ncbi:NELL2-interacting cell ontogeny regulator 1 isoform X1 [Marmota flaviventris]|uniref:NELL2-interacting cell ontogeny regulator 1 isoform X1 n=1 Tax=Marmota flaviventris TaxID=93162 RepID=UPI003A8AF255
MAPPPACRSLLSPLSLLLLLLSLALLGARAEPAAGSVVPAQSRPCVDCHAFEFMQRALQDLRKTARSLDAREEEFLEVERRGDPPPTSPGAFSCTSAEGTLSWILGRNCPHLWGLQWETETLLLQAERRALCACWPAGR